MKYYLQEKSKVLSALKTSENGLSQTVAEERVQTYGKNKLAQTKKQSIVVRFLKQFADPMIIVLLVAAVLSGITSVYSGESIADVFIILFNISSLFTNNLKYAHLL